ncbi:calcium-activated chloride channel regulator 1-like [Haliotis cracherodii]|uniref:calcium-activated chloride channel regulator 1-like n=1 Tax=Haliotis cracherodii TaxID=6455 RepID=UPI0039EBB5C6
MEPCRPVLTIYLLLAYLTAKQTQAITRPTAIKLENNGYTKVLFAIHQDVTESQPLLDSIKDMITKSSAFMYTATQKRAYFKEVTILVPSTWTGSYSDATSEVYTNADVVVEKAGSRYGSEPYSRTYSGCGRAGIRVYLTEAFMTSSSAVTQYGPREKVLTHEWAHFRWGVFDEYPQEGEQKFYFSPSTGKMEAVRCNIEIYGQIYIRYPNGTLIFCRDLDPHTGRFPDDCSYRPDARRTKSVSSIMDRVSIRSIVDFCDDDQSNTAKVHNREAPNKHNRMCGQRSTWAVISETEDFKEGNNRPRDGIDTTPTIKIVKATTKRRVALVLDTSGSMLNEDKLTRLRQTASNFIMNGVDSDADVGVVSFSSTAHIISPMTPIQNSSARHDLKLSLPRTALGGTSIGKGVRTALEMLKDNGENASGSAIVVLTDGVETVPPFLKDVLPEVKQAGAIVSIMAFSSDPDDNFASSATDTGGLFYYDSNEAGSTSLGDAVFDIYTTFRHDRQDNAVQLLSRAAGLVKGDNISGEVNVDVDIGRDTHFFMTYLQSEPDVTITSPTGRIYKKVYPEYSCDNEFKTIKVAIPEIAESGRWKYSMTSTDSDYQKVSIMVVSRPVDPKRAPIRVETSITSSNTNWPAQVILYADVTKSIHPVTGLRVQAVVDRPFAKPYIVHLLDNGAGADITKDDGVYSRYFTKFSGNGRYSVRIEVSGKGILKTYQHPSNTDGFLLEDHLHPEPIVRRSVFLYPLSSPVSRVTSGGAFVVSHPNLTKSFMPFDPAMLKRDDLAPVRITDLKVMKTSHQEGTVVLSWTAPGDDIDYYTAQRYQIRIAPNADDMINDHPTVSLVSQKDVLFGDLGSPKPAGSSEVFKLKLNVPPLTNASFVFSIRAIDDVGNWGDNSNYATTAFGFVPDYTDPDYVAPEMEKSSPTGPSSSQKLVISGVVGCLAVLLALVIMASLVLFKCGRKPNYADEKKLKGGIV